MDFAHFSNRLRTLLHRAPERGVTLPRWRRSLVGYFISVIFVALGLLLGLVETRLNSPFSFPGVPLLFAIVLIAFFWGMGSAIFATLLSLLVLDFLYISPPGVLGGYEWDNLLQLLTFVAAGIIISMLASQRESARLKEVATKQESLLYAHQLRATFDAMSDGVVVYDQKGQVQRTNAAVKTLLGISTLPAKDQADEEQNVLRQAIQHDEQGQLLSAKRQPLVRLLKGEILTGSKASDVQVQTPDGRRITLNMSGAPIQSETGAIEQVVLIYRDVTERRKLEQQTAKALHSLLAMAQVLVEPSQNGDQNEKHFVAEKMPAQIAQRLVELTLSIIECKHVALLAVAPEEDTLHCVATIGFSEQEGRQWQERLIHSPSIIEHLGGEILLSQLKDNQMLILDGMTLPFYTQLFPYYVQTLLVAPICFDQRLIGILCIDNGNREHSYTRQEMALVQTIVRLMTLLLEREQLQRERAVARTNEMASREANRRMEEFLSIICHELKTPLTIMLSSIQLAERKVIRLTSTKDSLPNEAKQFVALQALLERTKSQVISQDHLVNDLLDVSRIQAQTMRLHMTICNLNDIIRDAVGDQFRIAPSRTILQSIPTEKETYVYGDATRLMQVLTNYLTNALKYSQADRPVRVSLSIEKQIARVSVQDEGPGIPEKELEQIWQRFYRVPGIEIESGSGIGLGVGLHLCRTIIEQHGGSVGVQSTPGEGSTFWFTLPLAEADEQE